MGRKWKRKWKGIEIREARVEVRGKKNGKRNEGVDCGRLWRKKKWGEKLRNGKKLRRWEQPVVWRKKNRKKKTPKKKRRISRKKNEGGKK